MQSINNSPGGGAVKSEVPDNSKTNLIINYLPQTLQDDEFFKIFCEIGPIKSSRIMRDHKTGYSFGFGFIDFVSPESASKAIAQLNNYPIAHKRIKVSYARPPGSNIKETNLYITNIPKSFSEADLESLFSQYGDIVQRTILKDKASGQSKGVGFVRFDKKEQADAALEEMNGYYPPGQQQHLTVRVAEEHGKQKAAYFAGYMDGKVSDDYDQYSGPMQGNYMGGGPRGGFKPRGGAFNSGMSQNFDGYQLGQVNMYNPRLPGKVPAFRPNKRFNPIRNDTPDYSYSQGYGDYSNDFVGSSGSVGGFRGGMGGGIRPLMRGGKMNMFQKNYSAGSSYYGS